MMGTTNGMDMQFDLPRIIKHADCLDELTVPFTKK
jgi:hypothetical protein